jgi:predicted secreted protein
LAILVRSIGVLLLPFLAISPSSAQSACSIRIKASEEGNVTAKRGETVTVCLPLNSGTGYSWQVQDGGDAVTLAPTSTYERDGTMPGASGTARFTMKPQTAGDYTLVFMLVPPGSTGGEQGRAFVRLKIQ